MTSAQAITQLIADIPENKLIFANSLYKERLHERTSESAYYQVLSRMCRAGTLCRIGKGTYYRPQKGKYGTVPLPQAEIILAFTAGETGVVVGYTMYNQLQLTTQVSKTVEIFSSKVEQKTKSIRNVSLRFYALNYSPKVKSSICMLEVLQNFESIQELNYPQFLRFCKAFAEQYNENAINQVLAVRQYKKQTLSFLKTILDYYGVPNNLSHYLSALSVYRHPTMEEIYETAQLS